MNVHNWSSGGVLKKTYNKTKIYLFIYLFLIYLSLTTLDTFLDFGIISLHNNRNGASFLSLLMECQNCHKKEVPSWPNFGNYVRKL